MPELENFQGPKLNGKIEGKEILPKNIVQMAKECELPSASYTYTDPIVFSEYAVDTMRLARKEGLENIWVTSRFLSKELFDLASPFSNAVNIDLESFSNQFYIDNCGGRLLPILEILKKQRKIEFGLK